MLLKPDAVACGLAGQIIARFEAAALKIVGTKMRHMDAEFSRKHCFDLRSERAFLRLGWLSTRSTYPARKAVRAVTGKVKTLCRRMDTNQPLEVLLLQLNRLLRGWCAHFRPGVSSATFAYLSAYTWARVIGWLRRKHRRIT